MSIHFAAVHERNSWRTHSMHESLEAATTGKDGAINLLLNQSRAPDRTSKNGPALAVFVWTDVDPQGIGYRLKPGSQSEVERVLVPVESLRHFKKHEGPSLSQIDGWFSALAEKSLANLESQAEERFVQQELETGRQYRYGDIPTWEVVLNAVREIGRPASVNEVGDLIVSQIPDFKRSNLSADLSVLSVNCFSRGNYGMNRVPRVSDAGNIYDKLIRLGKGRGVRFALYEPSVHGVWELADVGDKVLRPRFVKPADVVELERARDEADAGGMFDPSADARRRIMATIVQREGQPAFRRALLSAYANTCAISGCTVEALLEAAHIIPYRGAQTNVVGNGLLLRADLHKLFDLHLFRIDPIARTVHLSDRLKGSEYAQYEGVSLRMPVDTTLVPFVDSLRHHEERCSWMNATASGEPIEE